MGPSGLGLREEAWGLREEAWGLREEAWVHAGALSTWVEPGLCSNISVALVIRAKALCADL